MLHLRPAALAALTMAAALAASGCETHKVGADKRAPRGTAEPDIVVAAAAEGAGKAAGDGETGTDKTAGSKAGDGVTATTGKTPAPGAGNPAAAVTPPGQEKISDDCKKTASHLIKLFEAQINQQATRLPEAQRAQRVAQARGQLPALRASFMLECNKGWSAEAMTCVQNGASMAEVSTKCTALIERDSARVAGTPPPSASGARRPTPRVDPATIGGPACTKVSLNAAAIVAKSSGLDERQQAMLAAQVNQACAQRAWSAEVKGCVYRASRQAEFDECLRVARIEID